MKPDTIYKFVQELRRRRVFRGIIVYGASTLVLFEAATNLAQFLGHDSAPTWFVVMLGIGFFISLWFSWIYDITPGGIKKTEPESEQKVPIPKKGSKNLSNKHFCKPSNYYRAPDLQYHGQSQIKTDKSS